MWDAVRKMFRHDEAPETDAAADSEAGAQPAAAPIPPDAAAIDTQQAATGPGAAPADSGAAPAVAGSPAPQGGAPLAPSGGDTAGVTAEVEVSPPGHAPQGLAAEPTTQPSADATVPPAADAAPHAPDLVSGAFPPAEMQAEVAHTLDTAGVDQAPSSDIIGGDQATPSGAVEGGDETAPAARIAVPGAQPVAPAFETPDLTVPTFEIPTAPAGVAPSETGGQQPTDGTGAETTAAQPAAPSAGEAPTAPDGSGASMSVPDGALTAAEPAAPAVSTPAGDETVAAVAPGAAFAEETATPAVVAPTQEAVAAPAEAAAPAAALTPLAAGTVVGDRYTIIRLIDHEQDEPSADVLSYQAADARSFERCWSCGSADNNASTRFCQNCGAPIQNHPVTLLQTRAATGEAGEVEQGGAYFHVEPERRQFGVEGMGLEVGAYSAEGPHHPNEDSYWYVTRTLCANSGRRSTGVIAFADGMGGYAPGSGLISSRIVGTVGAHILAALDADGGAGAPLDAATAESTVRRAIAAANQMVLDEIARAGEMGATLVVVLIQGDTAYVANVGDSRAYYINPQNRATAITRDQSLVAQEVQLGHLAESDIYTAAGNNIILHAVGEEHVEDAADWYAQPLEPGSYLLVCSDGYWKTLRGTVIPDNLLRESVTLGDAARRMVDDALTQGSDDNTTVILIAIS